MREQVIFPEINYDDVSEVRGLNVTITTTAPDDDQARELLRELGMPFCELRNHRMAKESLRVKQSGGQVPDAELPPVRALRALARVLPQVRGVPHLPARAGPPGSHPRHDQEQLVIMFSDPIGDMLTRIRNANLALHETVEMPVSG